jgi:hypothetical protein
MDGRKQDWKRPAVLAVILIALIIYTLFRAVPERSNVDRLEAQLTSYPVEGLGDATLPVASYVRYYADVRPRTQADLRIAVPASVPVPMDRGMIVGVLVKPAAGDSDGKPGIRRVRMDELPIIGDGGCTVVDVIYDPGEDAIVDARCHGSLQPPPPEIPPLAGG